MQQWLCQSQRLKSPFQILRGKRVNCVGILPVVFYLGMYEESHGIIANKMYDPIFDETFSMATKDTKWWDAGHPLWVMVQRHGLRSGVYYWPGSESEIRGRRPNIFMPYNQSVPFRPRVDTVTDWLSDNSYDIDLAMLYFHEPDYTGYMYGPSSK